MYKILINGEAHKSPSGRAQHYKTKEIAEAKIAEAKFEGAELFDCSIPKEKKIAQPKKPKNGDTDVGHASA